MASVYEPQMGRREIRKAEARLRSGQTVRPVAPTSGGRRGALLYPTAFALALAGCVAPADPTVASSHYENGDLAVLEDDAVHFKVQGDHRDFRVPYGKADLQALARALSPGDRVLFEQGNCAGDVCDVNKVNRVLSAEGELQYGEALRSVPMGPETAVFGLLIPALYMARQRRSQGRAK